MKRHTLSTIAIAGVFSISVLTGCSDTNDAEPMSDSTSEQTEEVVNPDITPEQTAFVNELLATPLPQDEATTRIEEAGYIWRLGTIDGEPQAVTMDYRIDRLTLTTQDGLVIDATWG
jgi:hypothetical protein